MLSQGGLQRQMDGAVEMYVIGRLGVSGCGVEADWLSRC